MKTKAPKWSIIPLLLCVALCVGLSLLLSVKVFAADCAGMIPASGITVEITPPTGRASKSAEVAYTITDTAGNGFSSAKVRLGLDGEWMDVTDSLERWESRYTGRVTITDNCAVTVRVIGQNGKVYEKMCYVNCFEHGTQIFLTSAMLDNSTEHKGTGQTPSVTLNSSAANTSAAPSGSKTPAAMAAGTGSAPSTTPPASATADPEAQPDTTPRNPTALTPDGQGTVMDDVTDGDGKEFFTITTPSENVFYLVIDKQRDNENVYFLNSVTENDLMALAEKGGDTSSTSAVPNPEPVCVCKDKCEAGAVNTACPVCVLSMQNCTGTAPAPVEPQEPEKPKEGSSVGTIVIVLLAMLAAGGAGWYFKIYRPKHELSDAEDFDELTSGGEEPMVNEDDDEPAPRRVPDAEPEEPDYYQDYPGEEPEDI